MNQNWNWLNTSPWNGFSKWLLNSSVERQIHFQWSLILLFSFICKTNYRAFCTTITGIKTTLFHLMNFNSNWTEEAINWKIVQSSMPTYWTVISTPQMCNAIWNYQNVLSTNTQADLRICSKTTLSPEAPSTQKTHWPQSCDNSCVQLCPAKLPGAHSCTGICRGLVTINVCG